MKSREGEKSKEGMKEKGREGREGKGGRKEERKEKGKTKGLKFHTCFLYLSLTWKVMALL